MRLLPNILSVSRGIAGFAMLFFPVNGPWFWVLYCWGGISDMVDGALARKLAIPHSMTNKLTGILLFCLPFSIVRFDALIPAVIVCISATAGLFEDFQTIRK